VDVSSLVDGCLAVDGLLFVGCMVCVSRLIRGCLAVCWLFVEALVVAWW